MTEEDTMAARKCKWVEGQEFGGDYELVSSCGKARASDIAFDENEYKFCPHCGKEIEGG